MNKTIFVCGIVLVGLVGCSYERRQFSDLRKYRRETSKALQIATDLKDRPAALDLALKDFNCYGGSTRGWSNWMLEYTSLATVEQSLQNIHNDTKERNSRRVAATWILWRRTRKHEHLQNLFCLVKEPGEAPVHMGRRYLLSTTTNTAIQKALTQPRSAPLLLTESEFMEYLHNSQIGIDYDAVDNPCPPL